MIYTTLEQASQALMGMPAEHTAGLQPIQQALYRSYESVVEQYGKFDWTTGAQGSHYTPAELNPFKQEGLVCANCSFYSENQCEIVMGEIEPQAICKFWIIPEQLIA